MAIPFVHHVLSRLRNLQVWAKNRQLIPITDNCWRDLELMINIIKIAHDGISMNIIVYRHPTHISTAQILVRQALGDTATVVLLGDTTSNQNISFEQQIIFWSTLRPSSHPGWTLFAVVCIQAAARCQ
jgi:hypothetical protein